MSSLTFHYRSAGQVKDGRPDRQANTHDRKIIYMNGERISANLSKDEREQLQTWALSRGFSIVSVYGETKQGKCSTWVRTEPVALKTPSLAA